jgi:hypothetical protein
VNGRELQFSREIASLQGRVDQLSSTFAASERVLSTLASQTEAALSAADTQEASRLARKMTLMRQRSQAVSKEIGTLQELIAVRRRLGGSATPGFL